MKKFLALIFSLLVSTSAFAVNPVRTLTMSTNNAISNSLTHTEQYQELFFQKWNWLIASGGTPVLSMGGSASTAWDITSNVLTVTVGSANVGGYTPGQLCIFQTVTAGGDMLTATAVASVGATTVTFNWTASNGSATEAGVLYAIGAQNSILARTMVVTGASGAGAWGVVEFPSGTISANSVHRVLMYVDDASDPRQIIGWRHGPGSWSCSNECTDATVLPTLTGVATSAQTLNLHPLTTAQNLRWNSWRTTSPNRPQRFMVKQEGVAATLYVCEFFSSITGQGGGSGNERWASFLASSTSDAPTSGNYQGSAAWNAINAAASADTTTASEASIWRLALNWTAGLDGFGNAHPQTFLIAQNVSDGRSIGVSVDEWALPTGFAYGVRIDASENAQSFQRYCFGDVAWFWPTGVTIE